jgi:NAD+ synthase
MDTKDRIKFISEWIKNYANQHNKKLVVGVSGGIDSGVVSTLCALTGLETFVLTMPIRQDPKLHNLSIKQAMWLTSNFANVKHMDIDLTEVFNVFEKALVSQQATSLLGFANSRSRLRMVTLYQVAQSNNGIVVGTGNKVEDFGVGFFTKYGDGGVDISPIGDCMKTEVWEMGRALQLPQEIIDAPPTDGLWDDSRTDEMQLGMSYAELEKAMMATGSNSFADVLEAKQHEKYQEIRERNLHKMLPIPVCLLPQSK